jgi:hypothetical protein
VTDQVCSFRSSETVATTALLSYNVYKAYINPKATGKQLMRFSNWVVPGFAVVTAAIAVGFNHAGFSVGFLVTAIGIFVDSCIVPMACTVMWKKQSRAAVIIAPLASSTAGILAWFLKAHTEYGEINITTLSGNLPLVAGNMMSLCGPLVLTPLITYIKPDNFDWMILKTDIQRGDDEHIALDEEVSTPATSSNIQALEAVYAHHEAVEAENEKILLRARNRSIIASVTLTIIMLIIWPIPMYATGYVFSKGFFRGWIVFAFLWSFFAAGTITLLPVIEARHSIRVLIDHLLHPKTKGERGLHAITVGVPIEDIPVVGIEGEKSSEKVAAKRADDSGVSGSL